MNKQKNNKQMILVVGIVIAVILLLGGMYFFRSTKSTGHSWYTVTKADVTEDVRISAEVKAVQNVDLAFARSGVIGAVHISVGDSVRAGSVLATLANLDIRAQVAQAEANLAVEKAKLAALIKGSRTEDIAVAEASATAGATATEEAGGILSDKTRDAYTTADDALHNLAAPMFQNQDTANPKLTFQTSDSKGQIALESERVSIGNTLSTWKTLHDTPSTSDLDSYALTVESNLREEINFYDLLASSLTVALPDSANTAAVLNSYRASITLGRNNLNTALGNVISAKQAYENAKANAAVSAKQLSLKKAGATDEDLAAENARVASAEASLQSAQAELEKTVITAPFTGVVTRVDAKLGATAAGGVSLISMISGSAFQIEGYVSEVDVPNVQKNAKAEVTLDAYGTEKVLMAHVASIDPAPTMVNGVGAYKAIIELDPNVDPGIKTGMHANVRIIAAEKKDVIAIPKEALISRVGKEYVELENPDGSTSLYPIETGLRGNLIEVTGGLSGGEHINSFGDVSNTNQ